MIAVARLLTLLPREVWLTLAAVLAAWLWGQYNYAAGGRAAVAKIIAEDAATAKGLRDAVEEALRDVGNVRDPDELLRATGGLRDEPGDSPGVGGDAAKCFPEGHGTDSPRGGRKSPRVRIALQETGGL